MPLKRTLLILTASVLTPILLAEWDSAGNNSIVVEDNEVIRAMEFQTDNKIVFVGRSMDGIYNRDMVGRIWHDGGLDTTFHTDGIAITAQGSGWGWVHDLAIYPDGRILTVGRMYNGETYDFSVVRYSSAGVLDTTFGPIALDPSGGADFGRGGALQTDGKIIVAGYGGTPADYDAYIYRLDDSGNLDGTFDTDGIVSLALHTGVEFVTSMFIQPDNKIVISGATDNIAGTHEDVLLARYLTTGVLDTTFDTDGVVITDIANRGQRLYNAILDTTGRILGTGRHSTGGATEVDFLIVRYLSTGELDTAFDTDGILIKSESNAPDHGYNIKEDSSGLIWVAGSRNADTDEDGIFYRMEETGVFDTDFSGDGIAIQNLLAGDSYPNVVLVRPDLVVAAGLGNNGTRDSGFFFRLDRDAALGGSGTPVAYFDTDGIAEFNFMTDADQAIDAVALPNGTLFLGGFAEIDGSGGDDRDFGIVKMLSDGSPDTTFDTDGRVIFDLRGENDQINSVILQTDGLLVAGGFSQLGNGTTDDFAVVRLNQSGVLDVNFETDGIALTNFSGRGDQINEIGVDPQGRIVAVGFSGPPGSSLYNWAIARYETDGALDTDFDTDGLVTLDWAGQEDVAITLAIQTDGKILLGGYAELAGGTNSDRYFAIVRYLTDGTLDNTFETDGIVSMDLDTVAHQASDIWLNSDGGFFAVTSIAGDFGILKFESDGDLDATFDTDGITIGIHSSASVALTMFVSSNQKIYIGGTTLGRHLAHGPIDTSFNGDGIVGFNNIRKILEHPDGRIIGVGNANGNFMARHAWP